MDGITTTIQERCEDEVSFGRRTGWEGIVFTLEEVSSEIEEEVRAEAELH